MARAGAEAGPSAEKTRRATASWTPPIPPAAPPSSSAPSRARARSSSGRSIPPVHPAGRFATRATAPRRGDDPAGSRRLLGGLPPDATGLLEHQVGEPGDEAPERRADPGRRDRRGAHHERDDGGLAPLCV